MYILSRLVKSGFRQPQFRAVNANNLHRLNRCLCDEIAQRFSVIEPRLKDYLSKHGAILKKEAKEALSLCIGIAGENKFNINGPDVPDAINAHAENLYNKLKEVEKSLLNQVHTQSST